MEWCLSFNSWYIENEAAIKKVEAPIIASHHIRRLTPTNFKVLCDIGQIVISPSPPPTALKPVRQDLIDPCISLTPPLSLQKFLP